MRDETTQVTHSIPGGAQVQRVHVPANRTRLAPVAKLTRAHLALGKRPARAAELAEVASRVAQKLGPQLKTTIDCKASVLAATLHPFSHLAPRALYVTLEFGGEAIGVLELDLLGAGAILAKITGGQEPAGVPTKLSSIEEAALGWTVLTALSDLRAEAAFAPFQPRLVGLTLDRGEILRELDARQRYVAVRLELTIGGLSCLSRVLVPALWLQSKVEALPLEPTPALHEALAPVELTARCFVGKAQLSKKDLASLAEKDVVLFADLAHGAEGLTGLGRLVTDTFELQGSFTEAGFTLTRALERPTPESAMSAADAAVPLEVEVELTRVRLPLSQLGAVHPGAVIPLHINAAQQVVLRVGDKAIARAELVEIEGEIGARIISML